MKEWIDNFYGSPATRQALEESFAPLFTELGAGTAAIAASEVGLPAPVVAAFVESMLQTHVENYLSSSRAQLTELLDAPDPKAAIQQRMAEWTAKRPGKVANETTYKTSNAVTQTVYKDAGVTRKKWSSRGKSCPYCKRMNGKVVDIEQPFHREGDSIDVPDDEIAAKAKMNFTHEIGHPPQHQGCDCVIEADIQQALPGFDGPEFAVPRKRGYIDPQLRPNSDPELAAMWDRLVDTHKNLVDRFGLESEWNGIVRRIDTGTAVAEWDGSISINVDRLLKEPAIREHNLIHEVFHTISKPSEAAFSRYSGWEEGLVDQMTILNRDAVWDDLGVKLTAKQRRDLLAFDADSSYGLPRYAWEQMRVSSGLSADDFYGQMLRTPLEQRPALAKRLGVSDFDLQRGLQILGGAD